jgi:hypothetical protein
MQLKEDFMEEDQALGIGFARRQDLVVLVRQLG